MKKEFFNWFSPSLGKDMPLNVYGHAGKPVIVFPSSGGSYYEYEDFGSDASPMISKPAKSCSLPSGLSTTNRG